ncbi:DUF7266 family protein [Natronococcus wangiae]|uniref:DUF7266 family protein n=1 Tax=Natronococcus wangiae TaxID=3068275 RepID=UPI00273E0BB0|nr:hypothetical protein [Natronococcus sp. AD5]
MTDRALSNVLSYSLLLAVTIVVVTGVSIAAGGLLESQQERAVQEELDVIGERMAADLQTADRLAQTESETKELTVTSNSPQTVSEGRYMVAIEGNDPTILTLEGPETGVTVETKVVTTTQIEETQLSGGTLEISYDSSADKLVVSNG